MQQNTVFDIFNSTIDSFFNLKLKNNQKKH